LDQLRMYTDFLIDLTLSLEESDKEQCFSPGSTNDEVERSLNNIEQESQKSLATRMEKTFARSAEISTFHNIVAPVGLMARCLLWPTV